VKKFSSFSDIKLQFFYQEVINGDMSLVKGLPGDSARRMQQMVGRIKSQHGRQYFDQVMIDDQDSFPVPSYNDFVQPDYLKLGVNSFLINISSIYELKLVSKGYAEDKWSVAPRITIYWLLGELFAIDAGIIAAYSFLDAGRMKEDIPFNNFMISEAEKEYLLYGHRGIPDFHGVNIFTFKRWQDYDPIKWECFDSLQTEEDAALLGANKIGSYNLREMRPSLERQHEQFIAGELKNIINHE